MAAYLFSIQHQIEIKANGCLENPLLTYGLFEEDGEVWCPKFRLECCLMTGQLKPWDFVRCFFLLYMVDHIYSAFTNIHNPHIDSNYQRLFYSLSDHIFCPLTAVEYS